MEPQNSPYHTTNAKEIFSQGKTDLQTDKAVSSNPNSYTKPIQNINPSSTHPVKSNPQPIVDLQIYPEPKKQNILAEKQASLPLQPFSLSSPFIPPQFQSYLSNFMKTFYTPFIYKDYNINLGGPSGDHVRASLIYEDALPPAEIYSSYKTVRERNGLSDYVRGTFITSDEGELVDFTGGPNSLNSRLKLIQLNPYNTNMFSQNPYRGLPKDLLIYRSCYPIVYDKVGASVQCNKSSVGLNVRVYKLTVKEFIVKYFNSKLMMSGIKLKQDLQYLIDQVKSLVKTNGGYLKLINPELECNKFNVWREISYYEFIRENICRTNICPNFVQSYCYFINKDANISYRKNGLSLGSNKKKELTIDELLSNEFSNNAMILLTESPNQNIYQWGSNLYVQDKGIKKMIYSGYKPESHWKSIIAQMLIIFYIMDKYSFTIREMEINANFYIKDLNVFGDNKQYWQYSINNIDYYIPNFGHLLMLDHNYKDLRKKNGNINDKEEFKVLMKYLNDDEKIIKQTLIDNAINCFHPNNFGSKFTEIGGVNLTNNISKIFNDIEEKLNEERDNFINGSIEWISIIEPFIREYIHNRVGTQIRDLELNYVKKNETRPIPFKKGELVIYEEKFETYKILLFLTTTKPELCKCITKNIITSEYEVNEYPIGLLYHYSEYDTIKQDGKQGETIIGYDHIIERYIL